MSLSPAGAADAQVGARWPNPATVVCGNVTIPLAHSLRRTVAPHPPGYTQKGQWIPVTPNTALSTSHFAVVSTAEEAHVVSLQDACQKTTLVEVRCQRGTTTRMPLPINIKWQKNTTCYIRELRPTCTELAQRACITPHDIVVHANATAYKLGTVHRGLVCDHCGFATNTAANMLHHLGLPLTCTLMVQLDGHLRPYVPATLPAELQKYLNTCSLGTKSPPFHLLPALSAHALRAALVQHAATSESASTTKT